MPCEGPSPSEIRYEEKLQRAARLLTYVLERLSKPVPPEATARWPAKDVTPQLCETMRELQATDPGRLEAIVYDAHSSTARDLADWWEEHQAADRARELKEGSSFAGIEVAP